LVPDVRQEIDSMMHKHDPQLIRFPYAEPPARRRRRIRKLLRVAKWAFLIVVIAVVALLI
jgi:hypothetical protein